MATAKTGRRKPVAKKTVRKSAAKAAGRRGKGGSKKVGKMPKRAQPDHIHAIDLPVPAARDLDPDMQKYFALCEEKLGMVPNVLWSYAATPERLRAFVGMYNELMLSDGGLSRLEREMIATAVSNENQCYYCTVAHGAGVRELSGDPTLGELMAINYRAADLPERQRAMLDFAVKMTNHPAEIGEEDRQALRDAGFSERDILDIACIAAFFNMTNRSSTAVDRMPNMEYHTKAR